jgi:hypothetical protein
MMNNPEDKKKQYFLSQGRVGVVWMHTFHDGVKKYFSTSRNAIATTTAVAVVVVRLGCC